MAICSHRGLFTKARHDKCRPYRLTTTTPPPHPPRATPPAPQNKHAAPSSYFPPTPDTNFMRKFRPSLTQVAPKTNWHSKRLAHLCKVLLVKAMQEGQNTKMHETCNSEVAQVGARFAQGAWQEGRNGRNGGHIILIKTHMP